MSSLKIIADSRKSTIFRLKFTGFSEAHAESDANLKKVIAEAIEKTEAKSPIVEKLEKVRVLAHTIETIGDAASEASS